MKIRKISMKVLLSVAILLAVANYSIISCRKNAVKAQSGDTAPAQVKHPEWSKNLSICEVNVRIAKAIEKYLLKNDSLYPADAYRMNFITNQDENSWNETDFERPGECVEAFFVLTVSVPEMPLVYSGQESAMKKELLFFEKDLIYWGNYKMAGFYKTNLGNKKTNPALFNGSEGGNLTRVNTTAGGDKIFAILREKGNNRVFTVVNLSSAPLVADIQGKAFSGDYTELISSEKTTLKAGAKILMPAWGYKVFFK